MTINLRTIFQGDQLLAKLAQPSTCQSRLIVTFDHLVRRKVDFDQDKELFFARHGVSHLHVFTRSNHWFQVEESHALAGVLNETANGFKDVVAYGSSMGAYGALIFSRALQAKRVFCFSPQYSVDPEKVPFDGRWKKDRLLLSGFHRDTMAELLNPHSCIELFYDPFHKLDSEHARLIHNTSPNVRLASMPFSGHPTAHVLNTFNLLGRNCISWLFEEKSYDFPSMWRESKRQSAIWRVTLIRYLLNQNRDSRLRTAVLLIEQAESNDELDPENQFTLGRLLLPRPDFRLFGLRLMEKAIARKKKAPKMWRVYVTRFKRSLKKES